MAAFASQQSIDGLEDTSYYQNELDRIRNRGASVKGNASQVSGGGNDFLDGWLDFYNKQKSPIYDGKGNQIGFDHGYGVRENWEPQQPGDDKWISEEEWEQLKKEPSPPSDQPPRSIDEGWTSKGPGTPSRRGQIENILREGYQNILGRDADAEGLKYWTDQVMANPDERGYGRAIQDAMDNINRSEESINRTNYAEGDRYSKDELDRRRQIINREDYINRDDSRSLDPKNYWNKPNVSRDGYGSRVGVDLPPGTGFTMDWRDSDGDGIDDRHQRGPGQPDEGPWSNRGDRGGWEDENMPPGWGGSGTPPRRGESMEDYNRRMREIQDRWDNRRPPRWRGDDQFGPGDPRPPIQPGLPRPPEDETQPYPMPGPRPPIDETDPIGPRPPRPEIPPEHGYPDPRPPVDGGWTPGKPIVSKEQEVIESFYNNILRRGSDKQGMDYWLGQAEGGMSLADIEKSIANSAEAQKVSGGRPPNIGQPDIDPQPPRDGWISDDPNDWLVPFGDDQTPPSDWPSKDWDWDPKPIPRDKYPAYDDKGREIKYDEQNRPTTNPGVGDEDYRRVHITYAPGFEPTPEEHRQNQKRFWKETEGPLTRLGIKRQEEAQRLDRKAQELREKRGDRPMEKRAAKERADQWQRDPRPVAQPTPRKGPRKSQAQVDREREIRSKKERAGKINREAIVRPTPRPPVAAPAPSRPAPQPAKSDWLEQAYQSNLGRSADAGGKAYWAKEVASGRQTKDQVIANIRRSDEYKNRNR